VTEPLLCFDRVSRTYLRNGGETVPALREVDLELREGEAVGIFGASGAGKSTMARLALGLERPDTGAVRFRGRNLAAMSSRELWSLRRSVQIVWQDPAVYLNPYQSVLESVSEPLEVHRMTNRDGCRRRAVELMNMIELPVSARRLRPYELSGGQCQRVAIARAIALEPSLLVCDEALSSLDLAQQVRLLELLSHLRCELHLSFLFIAHDQAAARLLCSRLLEMRNGCLRATGSVAGADSASSSDRH
jgi:ABC-type glutathione transport system ATPase component